MITRVWREEWSRDAKQTAEKMAAFKEKESDALKKQRPMVKLPFKNQIYIHGRIFI